MKKFSFIILNLLIMVFFCYSEEDSGAMKDFIMKGHLLKEIDLSYCSFDTLIKLNNNYKQISIKSSTLPNSPKDSTIEKYDFPNFIIEIFRWKNGIKTSDKDIIYTEILSVSAKENVCYQNNIKIGMTKEEIEKKLGKIDISNNQSIHRLIYFFDLILTFNDNILKKIEWKRNMEE